MSPWADDAEGTSPSLTLWTAKRKGLEAVDNPRGRTAATHGYRWVDEVKRAGRERCSAAPEHGCDSSSATNPYDQSRERRYARATNHFGGQRREMQHSAQSDALHVGTVLSALHVVFDAHINAGAESPRNRGIPLRPARRNSKRHWRGMAIVQRAVSRRPA